MQVVIDIPDKDIPQNRQDFIDLCLDFVNGKLCGAGGYEFYILPKGRWKNGFCSECGEHALYPGMSSGYYQTNFCPYCGAKMKIER